MSTKKNKKYVYYFMGFRFLPGDGSPRLIPLSIQITEKCYEEMKEKIESSEPMGQFVIDVFLDDNVTVKERINWPQNARLFGIYVDKMESDLPIGQYVDEWKMDQSVPDGFVN